MTSGSLQSYSIIDAHCHLDFDAFNQDRSQVLGRAAENSVQHLIIPGTKKKYWQRISNLCNTSQNLHPCYGLHPYWVAEHTEADIDALDSYIDSNPCVALGECGLDFRTCIASDETDKQVQYHFFEAQLQIANSKKLPVVIHAVRATEDVIKHLKNHQGIRGMIHSYSGSPEQAKRLTEMGFYISVSASITYNQAARIKQVAKSIPLEFLLVETDAPDQPDAEHQQQRNEPAYITATLQVISELRKESVEIIAEQTTANAKKLFGIR